MGNVSYGHIMSMPVIHIAQVSLNNHFSFIGVNR
jgi:hypothetical protein